MLSLDYVAAMVWELLFFFFFKVYAMCQLFWNWVFKCNLLDAGIPGTWQRCVPSTAVMPVLLLDVSTQCTHHHSFVSSSLCGQHWSSYSSYSSLCVHDGFMCSNVLPSLLFCLFSCPLSAHQQLQRENQICVEFVKEYFVNCKDCFAFSVPIDGYAMLWIFSTH